MTVGPVGWPCEDAMGRRKARPMVNVLPDLADWHRPGCCRPSCPAADRGRDPAECALRLTGTCADCGCEPPVRVHG